MSERVLVVAAHPDDEVLGCGATIAKHCAAGDAVSVVVLADGVGSRGFSSAKIAERHGMCRRACKILGTEDVWLHQFADNQMDSLPILIIVKQIETHIDRFKPTIVYTHSDEDLNVDHCVTHGAVRVACRPQPGCTVKQLFFFEAPCSSVWGGGFDPNYFVNVADTIALKMKALEEYASELRDWPHPRSRHGITTLAGQRGSAVGLAAAEAFVVGRVVA